MSLSRNAAGTSDLNQRMLVLVSQAQQGITESMPALWDCVERLCAWYCRRLYRHMPERYLIEYNDLYNCGYIALCDAVAHFDPTSETRFSFYYLFYLTAAIYRENSLPRGRRGKDGKKCHNTAISQGCVSIDAPLDGDDEKPRTLQEILCAPCSEGEDASIADAINQIYLHQLHEALEVLIRQLPKEEQFFVRRKYYDDANRKCIAAELGITAHQAIRLEENALSHLRDKNDTVGLKQFIDARINYYAGTGLTRFKETGSSVEKLVEKRMELESRYQKLLAKFQTETIAHSAQ